MNTKSLIPEKEFKEYYLDLNVEEQKALLSFLEKNSFLDLFTSVPTEALYSSFNFVPSLTYNEVKEYFELTSKKNKTKAASFLTHGLESFSVPEELNSILNIRGLTTSYTPYQPERGQGTLIGLWLYANLLHKITGMEAINASLYDRSWGIFEAICIFERLAERRESAKQKNQEGKYEILFPKNFYSQDTSTVKTLLEERNLVLKFYDALEVELLSGICENKSNSLIGLVIPSQLSDGRLPDVHALTKLAYPHHLPTAGIFSPFSILGGIIAPPAEWGGKDLGVSIAIGECQNLCLAPNFGGPGLGFFGIRYNEKERNLIRFAPGRFVGKTKDESGKDCFTLILSTREQHIRREKATSNICSNQSFVATLAASSLLMQGRETLTNKVYKAIKLCRYFLSKTHSFLSFLQREKTSWETYWKIYPHYEVAFSLKDKEQTKALLHFLAERNFLIAKDKNTEQTILLGFNDLLSSKEIDLFVASLAEFFSYPTPTNLISWEEVESLPISPSFNPAQIQWPHFSAPKVIEYFKQLGDLNFSPDQHVYPLGSCTMKYNPFLNDFCASLEGFQKSHPEQLEETAQGNLEVLYEIQEAFKKITGLAAVTTQPVAGAQGELVGLKMFQAYFRSKGEKRDIILIPASAHGTNPATAAVAGILGNTPTEQTGGIYTLKANSLGQIDWEDFQKAITLFSKRIIGIMITNPNTSGIFESKFLEMAKKIHEIGGLVYMDGANMNAIAGIVNLNSLGVDAVHNNLHKTWSIPHGGGGPGDAIVAVSKALVDFLPGQQVVRNLKGDFSLFTPKFSIGNIHRHFGNFAHKIRALAYIKRLGQQGIVSMSQVAVLSANYLQKKLCPPFELLPQTLEVPRLHEFILTLPAETFAFIEKETHLPKVKIISQIGKLFLDFGIHAPTVSFPEPLGLMIEPTESFSKKDLDHFIEIVLAIYELIKQCPKVLLKAPLFAPSLKIDELQANKIPCLVEEYFDSLPSLQTPKVSLEKLHTLSPKEVVEKIKIELEK